jgi:adenylosuccinate synthase
MLAKDYDIVARACGGANAGHTIVVQGKKHVFRLLPSGCLHPHMEIILGSGMVIHLPTLLEEIELLRTCGIDIVPRLRISSEAHILLDIHKDIDGLLEDAASKEGKSIGTTRRGIGPAYIDKVARVGLRMECLGRNLAGEMKRTANRVQSMHGICMDTDIELRNIEEAQSIIGQCITDTVELLNVSVGAKKRILIEGAQATLLDIDHGTYPYVTSSSTTLAGALQGLGLAPGVVTDVIGVAKAYCTRVGAGEFLTEVQGEVGDRLRERGGEYGSVTKRPRRCGWLHLPDLKRSAMINGYTCWNITKLDVLDTEQQILIGMGASKGKAEYRTLPGWRSSTSGISTFDALPKEAQDLLLFIEKETGVPVRYIGTGQGREAMILR